MNKRNKTVLSVVAAIAFLALVLFVKSPLYDRLFGAQMPEESGQTLVELETTEAEKTPKPEKTAKPTATPKPEKTAKPTATPKPEKTAKPTATPKPEKTAKPTATPKPEKTAKPTATPKPEKTATPTPAASDLKFRSKKLLNEHYEKHGEEMGFASAQEYEAAAAAVVANPNALHKTEKEDGDDVYYLEETNEFVIVSKDGYIRTYFLPSGGKKYYDRQ